MRPSRLLWGSGSTFTLEDCARLASAAERARLVIVPAQEDSPMMYEVPRALAPLAEGLGLVGPRLVHINGHERFYFVWGHAATGAGVIPEAGALLGRLEAALIGQPLGGWRDS